MLYQRCRPKIFDEIFGNREIVRALRKVVEKKPSQRPHTYLFHGPKGCGKTTLARIMCNELGCERTSLVELNAANTRGIDSVRQIAENAGVAPMFGEARCYLVDESHQLTSAAQEAFLKVIEDCPKHTYFMFCTTEPAKLIGTIKSRCAQYRVMPLRPSEMRKLLTHIVDIEGIDEKKIDLEIIDKLTKASDGCPRNALMLLEQIQDLDSTEEIEKSIEYMAYADTADKDVVELLKLATSKKVDRWPKIAKMFDKVKADPETIRILLLRWLKKMLLTAKNEHEAVRLCELIMIFEKPTYSAGDAILVRMLFESTLVE